MPNEIRPPLNATGKRVAVVSARFNQYVTQRLVDGAVDCLVRHGASEEDIDVYWVAGSFELGQMAAKISREGAANGIVCVGALIRGETSHYDVLCQTVASSLDKVARSGEIPVTFGVITAENSEQANDRAGGKHGNMGWNAAMALIELINHWQR